MPKRKEVPTDQENVTIKRYKKTAKSVKSQKTTRPRKKKDVEPLRQEWHIPDEIILKIMDHLPPKKRIILGRVSKQFRDVSLDKEYWKKQYDAIPLDKKYDKYKDDEIDSLVEMVPIGNYRNAFLTLKFKICGECHLKTGTLFPVWHSKYRLCEDCRVKPENALICKTRAKQEYLLKDDDIQFDWYMERPNPHYKCAEPMRLYTVGDMLYNAHKKHGGEEGFKKAKEKSEARKAKLRVTKERKEKEKRELEEKARLEKKIKKDKEEKERRSVLKAGLAEHGINIELLPYKIENICCRFFIEHGIGDAETIAKSIAFETIRNDIETRGKVYLNEKHPKHNDKIVPRRYFNEYVVTKSDEDFEKGMKRLLDDIDWCDNKTPLATLERRRIQNRIQTELIHKRDFWQVVERPHFVDLCQEYPTWEEFVQQTIIILLKWEGLQRQNWPSFQKEQSADKWIHEHWSLITVPNVKWETIHNRYTGYDPYRIRYEYDSDESDSDDYESD